MLNPKIISVLTVFFVMAIPAFSAEINKTVVIGDFETGTDNWTFKLGKEFKGAEGNFAPDSAEAKTGKQSAWIEGYFLNGGRYVGIKKCFREPLNIKNVEFWLKSSDLEIITIRITGSDNQTLQRWIKLDKSSDWQKITVHDLKKWPTHWGGKNDGILHLPAKEIMIILDSTLFKRDGSKRKKSGQIWLDNITLTTY